MVMDQKSVKVKQNIQFGFRNERSDSGKEIKIGEKIITKF